MDEMTGGVSGEPVVVLSDVHLGANLQSQREAAVCEVLARHPDLDIVFLGDLFEFSSTPSDPETALVEIAAANRRLTAELRQHSARGHRVYMVAGNHDAELASLDAGARELFGLNTVVVPWCLRLGNVHLEHGHVFDRDNAPVHPLAPYSRKHESLGAALMRSLVAGLDVRVFAHAHDLTPRRALGAAVSTFGWRVVWLACRVVAVFGSLLTQATWGRFGNKRALRREGARKVTLAAPIAGVSAPTLSALADALPAPIHASLHAMMWRLYMDWVCALVIGAACSLAWLWGFQLASWGVAVAILYLVVTAVTGRMGLGRLPRYRPPLQALLDGASVVVRLTSARRVVFGHTHVEYDDGVYFNLGSFGYGCGLGRPYAIVAPNGEIKRRFVAFDDDSSD